MNHLAHALIAHRRGESIVGHLLGDFVRGAPEDRYDPALAHGVRVHRSIDAYTDDHPVFARSRRRLQAPLRRYAGILVDVFYDHVLANRWSTFHPDSLRVFADRVYADLAVHRAVLPEPMRGFSDFMTSTDLLVSYRELAGVDRALRGVSRRMRRRNPLAAAARELERQHARFEGDFLEFFPQLLGRFE